MFKRGLSQSELHVGLISSKYYPAVMLTLSMLVTFVLQAGRPRSASNSDFLPYLSKLRRDSVGADFQSVRKLTNYVCATPLESRLSVFSNTYK